MGLWRPHLDLLPPSEGPKPDHLLTSNLLAVLYIYPDITHHFQV